MRSEPGLPHRVNNYESPQPQSDVLSNIYITYHDVLVSLSELDPTKAMRTDELSPRVLRNCASSLCILIHHLISLSLTKSRIPLHWKVHRITPIYKNGDKHLISNYRPIFLLCIISKVLEHLIYKKIIDHILPQISPNQFGFLPHHSCLQQLLLLCNTLYETSLPTDVIYLDFRKAFDSVPHHKLLCKLYSFKISGKLWIWFYEYLSSRQQYVSINHQISDILPVRSGVPKGSILGLLLFIMYVNDIPNYINHCTTYFFADDAKCIKTIDQPSDCTLTQADLTSLVNGATSGNYYLMAVNAAL